MAFIGPDRQVHSSLSEINVTPLVDVMLVLLVIFMVTAPLLQTGIHVNLPRTRTAEPHALSAHAILVTVDRDGNIYLGAGGRAAQKPVNVNELPRRLREELAGFAEKRVYVRGDGDTPYRVIAYVLSLCKEAGASVSLVTDVER
ncbi:MAG: biopolymer transporter ExbD [Blastocatellia bacterium]|nr:biopolymer transporter ExbD [Blastocatellia bacterium]MCS7158031.1 biopolymer transporter ExbD [Blastocatellia bacterium]MCX7752538.1 biopolymer transporter ExbD [Blastocatellia bacterium]MDW8167347.1 biopolymer transporter ExbD [Acidobacteriota bacterium]MDW8257328.1 biopolymer transporter ExbD [Acidobacteriota bacterium]